MLVIPTEIAPQFKRVRSVYTPPWLYPKQRAAIFDCVDPTGKPARYALVEASTKSGKTFACLAWLLEAALKGRTGQNFWWVAPVRSQAKIAFRRMKLGIPRVLYIANESEMTITLSNGATMWFKSGEKPDNLYGEDVYAAVIDEASRVRENSWFALRSTLTATNAFVRMIGNVKGRSNWFFKMARRAEYGEAGMAYAKITAMDAVAAEVLKEEEIRDARKTLPDIVFKELYEAEAGDDQGNPFGLQHIANCVSNEFSELPTIACGVDLGKFASYSVIIGLDKHGHCTGLDRFQLPWAETKGRILSLVGHAPTLVDGTGVGDPVVEDLSKQRSSIEPFVFTSKSKQQLLLGLAFAFENRLVRFPDGPLRKELEAFEYENTRTGYRFFAPEGFHDDCVMALALAWEMFKRHAPDYYHAGPVTNERESPWRLNAD